MQRCLSHPIYSHCFLDRSANCCALWWISGCCVPLTFRIHGRKQKYFFDLTGVCEKHGAAIDAQATASCGCPMAVSNFSSMHMASSLLAALACSLKTCLLLHGTIYLTVGTAHFLLHYKSLRVFRVVHLAKVLIICGWSQVNVGLMQATFWNSLTSLAKSLTVVRGGRHSIAFATQILSRNILVPSVLKG